MIIKSLQVLISCLILGISFSAHAGWKWTDLNARVLAKSTDQLENRIVNIYSFYKKDLVLAKDAEEEQMIKVQNQMSESLSELLYMAHNSPQQERFLKRVSRNAPTPLVQEMKRILKYIDRSQWMDEAYINDLILEESERISKNSIKTVQVSAKKKIQKMKFIAKN